MNISAPAAMMDHASNPLRPRAHAGEPPFAEALRASNDGGVNSLRGAAEQLVASALVLPALATLHQSSMRPASGPFAATAVEKRFAPLLEVEFADRVTRAARFGLVERIVERFGGTDQTQMEVRA